MRAKIKELYEYLSEAHGPSHWWPSLYGGDYEIICGAILTQNTAWRNVEKSLINMREQSIWDWTTLYGIEAEKLGTVIRSSGYYNTKALKLKTFAKVLIEEYDGSLRNLYDCNREVLRKRLLDIWGIGEETADDIILYSANKVCFIIDRYTMRIVDRLGWKVGGKGKYGDYQRFFEDNLEPDLKMFQEYHGLLDMHAARVCKAKPLCDTCCLKKICPSYGKFTDNGR